MDLVVAHKLDISSNMEELAENIKRIRDAGGLAFVVRSRDEVKHIINQLMNGEL